MVVARRREFFERHHVSRRVHDADVGLRQDVCKSLRVDGEEHLVVIEDDRRGRCRRLGFAVGPNFHDGRAEAAEQARRERAGDAGARVDDDEPFERRRDHVVRSEGRSAHAR